MRGNNEHIFPGKNMEMVLIDQASSPDSVLFGGGSDCSQDLLRERAAEFSI